MKKILSILLISVLSITLVSCSTTNNNTDTSDNDAGTTITTTEATSEPSNAIEKDIDAVAAYLGYSDGVETYYSIIGATAGKEYDGGSFELYQFDENSQAYKDIIDGNGYLTAAAYKDGIILIFPNGESGDKNIIEQFNSIEFK